MKKRDGWKTHCQEVSKDRDTWRGHCQEVAKAILPILDIINPELLENALRALQLGLIERCQRALLWLQEFVKESTEFVGAHVLSLVRAQYPLIDLAHLEARYPQGYTPESAGELRVAQMELSSKLTEDLELCGELPPCVQEPLGMPSIVHPMTPSSSHQPVRPAV